MANGAADAALRRKLDDLSAAHAEVVAGLSTEVERLQTVAHGLMLQLVLNGLTPQVPTGTAADAAPARARPRDARRVGHAHYASQMPGALTRSACSAGRAAAAARGRARVCARPVRPGGRRAAQGRGAAARVDARWRGAHERIAARHHRAAACCARAGACARRARAPALGGGGGGHHSFARVWRALRGAHAGPCARMRALRMPHVQVMPAAEPATTPPRISLAPAPERTPAPASTSSLQSVSSAGRRGLLRTSSVPQFARSERQSLPLSPSASSTSSLAARSAGRARPHGDDATRSRRAAADAAAYLMDEERPLASTWSPAGAAMAAAGSGGSAALREEAGLHGAGAAIDLRTTHTPFVASPSDLAAATASAHSNPIGGAGLGSDVPRVLLRKGGGSYSMRKPRNLAPIGATERSALGGTRSARGARALALHARRAQPSLFRRPIPTRPRPRRRPTFFRARVRRLWRPHESARKGQALRRAGDVAAVGAWAGRPLRRRQSACEASLASTA